MYYVYCKYLSTEREVFCKAFDTEKEAIEHVYRCYKIDRELHQLGDNYYFIRRR